MSKYDAIVVGSGPNGLSAAIELARKGAKVLVIEGAHTPGGGTRTEELTLPGFHHDVCSAVHPTGLLSPYWRKLPLEEHGLRWLYPEASVAHPLEGEEAVLLSKSIQETVANLGSDGRAWARMVNPFLKRPHILIADSLGPLRFPKDPLLLARFGLKALLPATVLGRLQFKEGRARALLAGCSAHSILPLDKALSSAVGLLFAVMGHVANWPVAAGGSFSITQALMKYFLSLGGEIQTGRFIHHMKQLPDAKVYLFNVDPVQLADIAATELPTGYVKRLRTYHYGPGVFKLDWALKESIPWSDPRCLKASTVHVGGTMDEINHSERAAWEGRHVDRPFVMVCQQSECDPSRAPEDMHTGYGYCHVPFGSEKDMTSAIENQMERFAPGFKDIILDRHVSSPAFFTRYNPNYLGGAITGGAADLSQLFTRPVARWNPYSTPNKRIFICSASTPPGGGVHGMCGYFAAQAAMKRL